MKKKPKKTNNHSANKNEFAKKNFICNVIIVILAIVSCVTYIAGNLISLYNYYEVKNQNELAASSDLFIPSIVYNGTIGNKDSLSDYIFKGKTVQNKNTDDKYGFVEDNVTVYNNGNYNASDIHIEISIRKAALDYIIQFIKEKNLNLEISYKERFSIIDYDDKDSFVITIQEKYKNIHKSKTISTHVGDIKNIKKDSNITIDFPDSLDFFIKFSAYLKIVYNDNSTINELLNPIKFKIKSFGRENKVTYKTINAHMGGIRLMNANEKGTNYIAVIIMGH